MIRTPGTFLARAGTPLQSMIAHQERVCIADRFFPGAIPSQRGGEGTQFERITAVSGKPCQDRIFRSLSLSNDFLSGKSNNNTVNLFLPPSSRLCLLAPGEKKTPSYSRGRGSLGTSAVVMVTAVATIATPPVYLRSTPFRA